MPRPCKSVKVLDKYSQTKAEIQIRLDNEEKLKGGAGRIISPSYLNINQKKIFKYIVAELKASGILGNLDIFILTSCVIAIDRLQEIEGMINLDFDMVMNKDLMAAKDKYTKDLFRCTNELSLSPQSRAKLSNINLQAEQNSADPLLKLLGGGNK